MATKKTDTKGIKNTPQKPRKAASINKGPSWLFPLILILFTFLLYSRIMGYEYVKMDDTDLIVENEPFLIHSHNLGQAFKQSCFEIPAHLTDAKSYYRPLLIVSFMIDAHIHGARSSATFHFMNILYHILVVLLLFSLLKKLYAPPLLAFVLSFLFAIHPVNVHAIAWVPGRNDPLLAIFTLMSFHGLINYNKDGKQKNLVLHLLGFVMALFSKESGIILLPLYFLFMWLWEKDILFFKRKPFIPVLYLVITVLWFIIRRSALGGHEEFGGQNPVVNTFIKNLPYLFLYIGKILLPFNLNVMPGVNTEAVVLGLISLAGLAFLIYSINDRKKGVFCILWYFLFLGPTLIVPDLPAYEHRDYLPLIGLLIGISQSRFFNGFSLKTGTLTYIIVITGAVFVIITTVRLPVFANRFDFWTDATDGTPFAPSGYVNVGQLYQEDYDHNHNPKELELAGKWNKEALDMDSTTLLGNNNYGAYLYLTGHQDEATKYFLREIKYNPHSSDPVKNMGIYYKEKGHPEKSLPYWEKLLKMNRFNFDAYDELIAYYKHVGNMQKADEYAQTEENLRSESEKQYMKIAQ